MEPWLDSLSEDWKSEHRSSSPAPSVSSNRQQGSVALGRSQSRIPHLASNIRKDSSNGSFLRHRSSRGQARQSSKSILRERSASSLNLPAASGSQKYSSLPRRTSSVFSESQNSVQHHSIHEKTSPAETPEWKRRLVAGEDINSDGFDLFSPSKLEGVFKQPNSSQLQSDRVEQPETGSLRKPFSLPATNPFPDQYSSYRINKSRLNLEILEEVNEEEEVEQQNLSAVSSELVRTGSLRGLVRERVQSLERVGKSQSTPSSPRGYNAQDPRWRTISGQEELRNEFISPVTVSKQNSIRDTVLRADIDIQALKTKLQSAASEEEDRPGSSLSDSRISYMKGKDPEEQAKDEPLPDLTSQSLPDDLSMGTQDFITHGGFINSRRGGRSNETSFLRKSLSLSQEPSQLEPNSRADIQFYSSPPSNPRLLDNSIDQSRLSASAPTTPQDTSVVHHTDTHLRPASSGSPLKLFGNRDTYTNNKLMRILSHFEEPDDSCEKLAGPELAEQAQETEFRMSQFGQGELDGFGFEQNVRRPSPIEPAVVDPEDRIFKPVMSQTSNISESTLNSAATNGALEPVQGSAEREEVINHAENDRTTKRRKTFINHQMSPLDHEVEVKVAELGEATTYAGKKRKDARPGDEGIEADPEVLAARDLLRPKSARRSSSVSRATVVPGGEVADQDLTPQAGNEDLTEALAAELATFAQEAAQVNNDSRKPSLATKDYMEEANKVMQFIRSRGKPKPVAALPNITEPTEVSELNPDAILDLDIDADSTKDDFSRPPSREHVPRPAQDRRHARHDSRTASYLRKYRDEDDMDALGSTSVFGTLAPANEAVNLEGAEAAAPEELQESNPPNMRILNAAETMRKRKYSSSTVEGQQDLTQERLAHAQQSYHSSTQQSFPTRSSASGQKGVISSGTVSIPDRVGAMTFDHDKKVWLKKLSTNDGSKRVAREDRQTMTEDDPFEDIPDLSIDEQRELQADTRHVKTAVDQKEAIFGDNIHDTRDDIQPCPPPLPPRAAAPTNEQPHHRPVAEEDIEEVDQSSLRSKTSAHEAKLHNGIPSKPPTQLKEDRKQARAVTIAFSSPIVSAVNYANLSEDDFDDLPREEDLPLDDSAIELDVEHGEQDLPPTVVLPLSTDSFKRTSQVRLLSHERAVTFQPRTISPIVEDDEELFQPRMSLVHVKHSDMVTPAPPKTIAKLQKTGNKASSILCLTPLSDFSLHQVDKARDPDQSYVDERKHPNALRQAHGSLALVVDELIKAITDAAPDELFWDHLRQLTLAPGSVSSVHALKDYCPSLEELNMSGNKISQLGGLPPTLRMLDIQQNLVNDLTSWSHLRNLQYLDVSGNRLESLEGFSSLVHLRSLNANNNQISNIDGVLDLDGLLELTLSDNDLTRVDFEGCDLKRLKRLDLSHNGLEAVRNIHCLPALEDLDISHNALQNFPTCHNTSIPIRKLRITHNELELFALKHMRDLRHLDLDNNKIKDIQGLQSAYHLEFLSLREQREQSDIVDLVLSTPNECRQIRLSSNLVVNGTLKLPPSPQNNLRELEIAACGISELPERFGLFFPNCRHLNANFNAIKEVDPLRKMVHLNTLLLAKNRVKRLRRTCLVMSRLPSLKQIDLRENPLTVGFYSPASAQVAHANLARYWLPDGSEAEDAAWMKVLDEVTGLKRRMIELMLAEHCKDLLQLDGLCFSRERLRSKDETWNKLTGQGVLVKPTTIPMEEADAAHGHGQGMDDAGLVAQPEVSIANDGDVFNG
ncbi:Leucine Rich repeat-containing protein [Cladophialophora immunda]|nr:Leucine Rich repeat-containing protein [Cladophialophora immunda]